MNKETKAKHVVGLSSENGVPPATKVVAKGVAVLALAVGIANALDCEFCGERTQDTAPPWAQGCPPTCHTFTYPYCKPSALQRVCRDQGQTTGSCCGSTFITSDCQTSNEACGNT